MYTKKPLPLPRVAEAGDALLTPAAFAKASGVSLSTVWRRLRTGDLPSVKRGRRRLIPADALSGPAGGLPIDDDHPIWKLVGAGKSGGAGPGSADKYFHLAEAKLARSR